MTLNDRADGITDFGIALAQHCNLVSALSFYKSIDQKTFSDERRNNMWCKWLK